MRKRQGRAYLIKSPGDPGLVMHLRQRIFFYRSEGEFTGPGGREKRGTTGKAKGGQNGRGKE